MYNVCTVNYIVLRVAKDAQTVLRIYRTLINSNENCPTDIHNE